MAMNRKVVMAICIVAVIALGSAFVLTQPRAPAGPTKIRMGYIPATTYVLVWVTYEKGYFTAQGLDVELKAYGSVADLAVALLKGDIDSAPLTSAAAAAFAAKAPFVVVGGNSVAGTGLVCKPEKAEKYRSLQDLRDVRIGTVKYVPGDILLRYMLKKLNVTSYMVEYITPADALYALERGDVELSLLWEPFVSLAEARNLTIFMWDKHIYDFAYPCCLQVFSESFVKAYSEAVTKSLKAMLKAQKFIEENPSEAITFARKYLPEVPFKILFKSIFYVDPVIGRTRNPLTVTVRTEDLQEFGNMMVDVGLISKKDLAAFQQKTDLTFLDRALKELGAK